MDAGKACGRKFRQFGAAVPFSVGAAGSPSNSVSGGEAYLHAKFRLDPSNRLATITIGYTNITDRTGQDRQTDTGTTVR